MCNALRNKDKDIAVILTEGIVKDIISGNPSKIIQVFVKSPLIWEIHVANNASYKTIDDLRGTKAAEHVQNQLLALDIIPEKWKYSNLVASL